jgi:hypothetical protein
MLYFFNIHYVVCYKFAKIELKTAKLHLCMEKQKGQTVLRGIY